MLFYFSIFVYFSPSPTQLTNPELRSKIAFSSWDIFVPHMKAIGPRMVCTTHSEIVAVQSTFPVVTVRTLQKYGFNFVLEIRVKLCCQQIFSPVITFHLFCSLETVYGLHLFPVLLKWYLLAIWIHFSLADAKKQILCPVNRSTWPEDLSSVLWPFPQLNEQSHVPLRKVKALTTLCPTTLQAPMRVCSL